MKYTFTPINWCLFIAGISASCVSLAINSNALEVQANRSISELYHTLNNMPNRSMTQRIDWISAQFKGKPYVLGSLGEGPKARYDQFPKYRADGFDCDTYVNTVLSLALANSFAGFENCLRLTRYQHGKITYIDRNHFTSTEWNPNNQKRGVLKDITLDIKDQQGKSVALFANAMIDKSGWYAHKTISTIRLQKANREEQEKRLAELKIKGSGFKITPSKLPYVPLTALFSKDNKANKFLFAQIPQGAIIEIVRPNWDLRALIGTPLNVSHMGFAIWNKKQLNFREASSELGAVVDVPLIDYLRKALKSPTIKGINIQVVVPQKTLGQDCRV